MFYRIFRLERSNLYFQSVLRPWLQHEHGALLNYAWLQKPLQNIVATILVGYGAATTLWCIIERETPCNPGCGVWVFVIWKKRVPGQSQIANLHRIWIR